MTTAEVLAAGVLSALLGIWSTYLLGLLTPGPNFLAIGAVAALYGFRSALPLIMGIVIGSCLQILVIFAANRHRHYLLGDAGALGTLDHPHHVERGIEEADVVGGGLDTDPRR